MAMALLGRGRSEPRDPTGEHVPRGYLFDELFVKRYDESVLDGLPQSRLDRSLPVWARLAREVRRRQDEYDVVVSWSERVSLSLLALDRLSPGGKPHIPLLYWFSRPSVQLPIRLFGNGFQSIVTWTSVQRNYAIDHLHIPADSIYLVRHYVDQLFWRNREPDGDTDRICSVGAEMRDYPTLLEALRGTDLRCHLAADHVRVDRFGFARRLKTESFAKLAGPNVTIGRKTLPELRALYARSRFVVVPLQASDTDNGITVILEAMAMGKPVICSRTRGQVDVIQEGVTGLFVPVGDAKALRAAMLELWNHPARAREMGRAARAYIEKYHALEKFCGDVKGAIEASLGGRKAARDGSFAVTAPPAA